MQMLRNPSSATFPKKKRKLKFFFEEILHMCFQKEKRKKALEKFQKSSSKQKKSVEFFYKEAPQMCLLKKL
jgi:hypothetical protein